MAIYHDIEEISYGPICGLPAIARVFLCIRHKLLRDGLGQKAIGHSFVMERTGLTKSQVIHSAKKLEANGIILIKPDFKESPNRRIQFFENKYELNSVIFGEEYNWYKNNPTFRAYSKNGKTGSYSKKGIARGGIESDTGVVSDSIPGVVSNSIPGKNIKLSELLKKSLRKNPSSNNPILKTHAKSKKTKESFTQKEWVRDPNQGDLQLEKDRQLHEFAEMQKREAGLG